MSDSQTKILEGLSGVINSQLFAEERFTPDFSYRQKRSCNAFSEAAPKSFSGVALVEAMYQRIETNLAGRPNYRAPSLQNWQWRQTKDPKRIDPSKNNESAEVKLERAIVQKWPAQWTYQMSVASGLFDGHSDKRRAVDLVFNHQDGHYDLVELKIKSDTPLYAAMEILGYGLVYLASRNDRAGNLQYNASHLPVLRANNISLCVLAPKSYYNGSQLKWLQDAINEGLQQLGPSDLKINFLFEKLVGTWCESSPLQGLPETLTRKPVWQ